MGAVMTMIPERSLQQRREAIRQANHVRSYRAKLKKDVKAGRADVVVLLLSDDPLLSTMKAYELLLARPRWGRYRVDRLFRRYAISHSKTIGGLSDRQRQTLVAGLRGSIPV